MEEPEFDEEWGKIGGEAFTLALPIMAESDERRKDSERLDWLESMKNADPCLYLDDGEWCFDWEDGDISRYAFGKTARKAIDAAMQRVRGEE